MKLLRPIKTLYEVWEDVDPGMTLTMISQPPIASAILFQVDISLQIWSSSFPQLFFSYFPSLGKGSILSFPDAGEWRFNKYFLRSSLRSSPYLSTSGSISSEVSSPPKGLGLFSHKVRPSCPRYQNPRGISICRELKKNIISGKVPRKVEFFQFCWTPPFPYHKYEPTLLQHQLGRERREPNLGGGEVSWLWGSRGTSRYLYYLLSHDIIRIYRDRSHRRCLIYSKNW